ncbi:carbon monoxide dehydrogenase subunit G [Terrabacter sp. NPDC000476]|uniref:SRPBCC family protein n=1 Tax=Terrabacter sp. NPDC000476 TaxID=3154258 RepID=UPI00331A26BB
MKITGSATLAADPQQVWDAFHDPAVLARCLPGCERLTELGPDHYAMTVTAGVAAIKGTYDGEVSLRDPNHPDSFTMKATGSGAPGTVDADVVVRLAPATGGGTALTYDADAAVGGVIGGVGQRMLAGVTKKMAGQFFSAVDADISGVRPAAKGAPAAAPAAAPGIPAATTGEAVAAPTTYAGGPGPAAAFAGREFALGVVTGGVVALVGVLVGWAAGRRG